MHKQTKEQEEIDDSQIDSQIDRQTERRTIEQGLPKMQR